LGGEVLGSRKPAYRKLRVYAVDPSIAAAHDTAELNELTLSIPWEDNPSGIPGLDPSRMIGPVGTYLEIVDHDPASDCFYAPVDLNETYVLANNGLTPSELNPQFHQQMVYAVAMKTIDHFERALGRVALWASRWQGGEKTFVDRLRIYPHALREANAYYNPAKICVLFGYFPAPEGSVEIATGTTVFTCLSHDVIAHEVTHALLDGLHERFSEPTNVDVLAFHEGFSDIVALFQHFANPEVLRNQIAKTRGDLERQNMLGQLAQQFGRATKRGKALRDALGYTDKEGLWHRFRPNSSYLESVSEPHDRGAVLVAAVFEAFLKMYKSRVVDLLRIASQGTGVLPAGELQPDLVNRLADEAAKSARHILEMCIRALDYCPPVDVTFGDYLRALVTSDYDLYPEDEHNYRTAVLQAFSQYGIRPRNLRNLSLEGLLLSRSMPAEGGADTLGAVSLEWDNETDRREAFEAIRPNAKLIHEWLRDEKVLLGQLGIVVNPKAPASVMRSKGSGVPAFEVHSVRTALRRGSKTNLVPDLVIEITQRRRGFFDLDDQKQADKGASIKGRRKDDCDFWFRRGCTLMVNQKARLVRWIARTPGDICDDAEMAKVRAFLLGSTIDELDAFSGPIGPHKLTNQFAAVHRH
jgi:hypothetical protein